MMHSDAAPLRVVGLGPGGRGLITGAAEAAVRESVVVAGYGPYVELIPEDWLTGKTLIVSAMRGEMSRCREAIRAALGGRPTALVCSGDPGVYALAGLVLELTHAFGVADRLPVEIIPGIPAVCAAASLLGAPLTHDFACVSLSDLLTPWPVIERRVRAALEGDFVLAIYNPRSRRRDWQLDAVLAMAVAVRGADGIAGVVRQAYRPEQSLWTGRLDALDAGRIDMLSIVLIGSDATCLLDGRMVTPRGYLGKYMPGVLDDSGGTVQA